MQEITADKEILMQFVDEWKIKPTCIYCEEGITKENIGGIIREGAFCKNIFCLIHYVQKNEEQLAKKYETKPEEKMKIKDVVENSAVDYLELEITQMSEVKEFTSHRGGGSMQSGIGKDETGQIKFVLWADDCGKYKAGDRIALDKCWAKLFNNELQVSTGKFGKITKLG